MERRLPKKVSEMINEFCPSVILRPSFFQVIFGVGLTLDKSKTSLNFESTISANSNSNEIVDCDPYLSDTERAGNRTEQFGFYGRLF